MKVRSKTTLLISALLIAVSLLAYLGCGSAKDAAQSQSGSSSITVGGSSTTGSLVKVALSSNRSTINVGDQAQITVNVSCATTGGISGGACIRNSSGTLVFAASPNEFQTGNDAPQTSLTVNSTYTVSSAGTLSTSSSSLTLAAGTRANSTASPAVSLIPGATSSNIIFSFTLTGAKTGSAIVTASVLDTIASVVVDVISGSSSLIFK